MTTDEIAAFVVDAAARAGMEVSDWLRMRKADAAHRPPPLASPVQLSIERGRGGVEFEVWKRTPLSTEPGEMVSSFRAPVSTQPQLGDVVQRMSDGGVYAVVKRRHEVEGDDPLLVVEIERITDYRDGY